MKIIEDNMYSFEQYRELVDKYVEIDVREINFQNRVILSLLEKVLINDRDISIVDVSTQFKNKESEAHTRKFYAWNHTPDLLIVNNWNYENKDKEGEDYLVIVEIKSPILDPVNRKSIHTDQEIVDYRTHCKKVILTDCYRWFFFDGDQEVTEIELRDSYGWKYVEIENPNFLISELGFPKRRKVLKEWDELLKQLNHFIFR